MSGRNPNNQGNGPPENTGLARAREKASAKAVINSAVAERKEIYTHVDAVSAWFHDTYEDTGDMVQRGTAISEIAEMEGISDGTANRVIAEIISDLVDPIVQIQTQHGKYVGIIDYQESDVTYEYTDYDDVLGERKVSVCAQCVHESDTDADVVHAKEHAGSFEEATYEQLRTKVEQHFEEHHPDVEAVDVETGASLLSGTTIASNVAFHAGNDGAGSGLDADSVDGTELTSLVTESEFGSRSTSNAGGGSQSGSIGSFGITVDFAPFIAFNSINVRNSDSNTNLDVEIFYADGTSKTQEITQDSTEGVSLDPSKVVAYITGNDSLSVDSVNVVTLREHSHNL